MLVLLTAYKILLGALWTEFDEVKGAVPIAWTPEVLTDEIMFSVSLRGMSVFGSRPTNISYSKMLATIPFPEYEMFSVSTVLFEVSEKNRGGQMINLISLLIPSFLMESAWIDLRQIQGIFQRFFEAYGGEPVFNKQGVLEDITEAADRLLYEKINVNMAGEKVRGVVDSYLQSYHVNMLSKEEHKLLEVRLKTLILLLNKIFEAGEHDRIQKVLSRINYILENELSEELVGMYRETLTQLIDAK